MHFLDFMYDDIGEKIKKFAITTFLIEAIGAIITGIVLIFIGAIDGDTPILIAGLITIFFGPIVAWISSWILYGFGQLIDNSDILVYQNSINQSNEKISTSDNNSNFDSKIANDIDTSTSINTDTNADTNTNTNTNADTDTDVGMKKENNTSIDKDNKLNSTSEHFSNETPTSTYNKPNNIYISPKKLQTKWCPHCGDIVNSKYCSMCGKENSLFSTNTDSPKNISSHNSINTTSTIQNTPKIIFCPHCGNTVNSRYCDICGKKNDLI